MKKISVIMPAFNAENFIEKSINSILSQTHSNVELIIVNDGSTDSTKEIINNLMLYDDRIKYKEITNSGVAVARNIGLEAATGDYIGFVDSDDYIEEIMLEVLIKKAEEFSCEIVSCGFQRVSIKGEVIPEKAASTERYYNKADLENMIYPNLFSTKSLEDCVPKTLWTKLISRKLIEENKIRFVPNLSLGEDKLFIATCFLYTDSFYNLPNEKLYNYVANHSSLTHTYTENLWENLKGEISYIEKIIKKIPNNNFDEQIPYVVIRNAMKAISNVGRAQSKDINDKLNEINEIITDEKTQYSLKKIEFSQINMVRKVLAILIKKKKTKSIYVLTNLYNR